MTAESDTVWGKKAATLPGNDPASSSTPADAQPDLSVTQLSGGTGKGAPPTPTPAQTSAAEAKAEVDTQAELGPDEFFALAPYQQELGSLPSEYASAMSGFNQQLSNPPSTGNSKLDAAEKSADQAAMAGESNVAQAAQGLNSAGTNYTENLQSADILQTALTGRKNQLLYGSSPDLGIVNQTGWSQNLQDIYKYIEGAGSGTDTFPANPNSTTNNSIIPSSGGAGAGQTS